jgi:hypothetical protein
VSTSLSGAGSAISRPAGGGVTAEDVAADVADKDPDDFILFAASLLCSCASAAKLPLESVVCHSVRSELTSGAYAVHIRVC